MLDESKIIANATLNKECFGVFYHAANKPVFSADRIQKSVAIFDSRPIVMNSDVISWKELLWTSIVPIGTELFIYVRTASSQVALDTASWQGPFLNQAGEDISIQTGSMLQFRLAMYSSYDPLSDTLATPEVNSITMSCYVKGTSQTFYTSTLSLGFIPTHIVITYNGTIPTGTMIDFAVTTTDSVKSKDFKIIKPNTVVGLQELDQNSLLKIAVSAIGNTEVPFVVDEFAVAIGGPQFTLLKT